MNNNWHVKTIEETLQALQTNISSGLKKQEIASREKIYGLNQLELFKRPNLIVRFLRQFHNILIYVLVISGIITTFLGHFIDASVIFGVIILNAIFGFIQEGKAAKAIEAIREMLAPSANVIRDGKNDIIPAVALVPGDIVLIKSGDKIPADLRLLEAKNLQIQEAILTGESNAVEKTSTNVSPEAELGDRGSMAYSGTIVIYGKGTGAVVATGSNTEIGKIGTLLKKVQPLITPLLQQINTFGRWLTLAIIILAVFTFIIGFFIWGESSEQVFMAAVGLAVAAIPEGLPPVLTIILAIGVTRMAKRNAIIRQLPAVETMGAVTTICTDKTGTLTRNEQTIKNIVTAKNFYGIEDDHKAIFNIDEKNVTIQEHHDLLTAINAAILCNDASFTPEQIVGNAVDKALLEFGIKIKIDINFLQKSFPRFDLIPYESENKFMATLHHDHRGNGHIYIKGAPERILEMCSHQQTNEQVDLINFAYWQQHINTLAHKGYRIIAIAYKKTSAEKNNLLFDDIKNNLTLIALFALIDAPRPEVLMAVKQCYAAGINIKMITGDHAATAQTIAAQVGIDIKGGTLIGNDIEKMNATELAEVVKKVNIYARTSPQHKLKLVNALQANGELVAMTGDGVNDAPALRQANIGIAMGQKGAEIAKEASAMVLADDNFVTIVNAVAEGRTVYDNLKKAIIFILSTSIAQAFAVVTAVLFGLMLPITPVQILWVNMITAVTLSVSLGFEPAENDVMQRPPRNSKNQILSPFLIWRTIFVTILLVASVFLLFILQESAGVDLETRRTIATTMLVLGEAVYLINCRKLYDSAFNFKTIFGSKPILSAIVTVLFFQVLLIYLPLTQHFFGTKAINFLQWLYIILLAVGIFVLVEIEKFLVRNLKKGLI